MLKKEKDSKNKDKVIGTSRGDTLGERVKVVRYHGRLSSEKATDDLEDLILNWTSTEMGRRSFLALSAMVMASCATRDTSRRFREGDNTGQTTELSVEDEKKLTQEVLPQMRKDYPPLNHPGMQRYISDLGGKIARSNNLEGNPYNYNFTVVDVDQVNAFALPAGTVFVTTPLIAMADTEAELAGVIGHEIGHIQARHTAERMDAAKKAQSQTWKYALGGGLIGAAAGFGLGKLLCRPDDSKCLGQATQLGAVAGAGGGLLVQRYGFMQNSQEDELEADRIGFRTAVRSGYHSNHVGGFFDKLYEMERRRQSQGGQLPGLQRLMDALSTHPPSRERVAQMRQMATESPSHSGAIVSTPVFTEMRKLAQTIASAKPGHS